MDTLPEPEFMSIFKRTTVNIDLRGVLTPEEIDERMKNVEEFVEARA